MNISKTAFKNYAACKAYYPLEKMYYKPSQVIDEEAYDFVKKMFDQETGEDLVQVTDKQMQAMLEYYKDVEKVASRLATKTFNKPFTYQEATSKQKKFTYNTTGNSFYTFLDCFYEDSNSAIVIEVKATTTTNFLELSATINKKKHNLFERKGNIISLIEPLPVQINDQYMQLFNKYSKAGKYIYDIAIEKYIVSASKKLEGKDVKYYLAILNRDYVYDGSEDYQTVNGQDVINFVDVTKITDQYLEIIDCERKEIENIILNDTVEIGYCPKCKLKQKGQCQFADVCFSKLQEKGSILELLYTKSVKNDEGMRLDINKLYQNGYLKITDIPRHWLTENQQIQYDCLTTNAPYINKDKIKAYLDRINYPLYHLDFESFNAPLPRFCGERPYDQSVFQFSVHIESTSGQCDIDSDNYYFLPDDFSDSRRELVKKLTEVINLENGGSVMVYNQSFEKTRLTELAIIFPEYKVKLDKINDAIIDLEKVVKNDKDYYKALKFSKHDIETVNYYNQNLKGSYSIKKVLPVFTNRTYEGMPIANGTEAICAYAEFKYLDKVDIEEIKKDLIKYCGLDTYSMVEILRKIREIVK